MRRYDPPMDSSRRWFAAIQLTLSIVAALPLLWFADTLPLRSLIAWALAITITLWLTGAVMQHRLNVVRAIGVQIIAVAVATRVAIG